MKRKIIAVALLIMLLFCVCIVAVACVDSPDNYTTEQHMQRIAKRVEKKYINEETRSSQFSFITGYSIYPLYNADDKVEYFLVEFEPYGFLFVAMGDDTPWSSMYYKEDSYVRHAWYRHRLSLDGQETELSQGIEWLSYSDWYDSPEYYPGDLPSDYHGGRSWYNEVDDEGQLIGQHFSPYKLTNVLEQKLYLFDVYVGFVPAVKQNGIYINLVSLQELEAIGDGSYYKNLGEKYIQENIPYLSCGFYCHNYL